MYCLFIFLGDPDVFERERELREVFEEYSAAERLVTPIRKKIEQRVMQKKLKFLFFPICPPLYLCLRA
jgi:hypothetical protein